MSGSMQPPQPAQMPPQGPQGGPPAPPPQMSPRMPPPGSPGAPQAPAAPSPMPPGMNPALEIFGRAAQGGGAPGEMRLSPAEMARLGRNGDSIVAHLTPGEIAVPPQVQTPKVLATLKNAFQDAGVQEEQFTAGSPQSSHNPQTGIPEYNFLSAILPMVFGAGASFLAPWALPGIFGAGGALAGAGGSALAGGLGSALGSAIGGGNTNQALMAGLGGAAGNFFGGGGLKDIANPATAAAAGTMPANATGLAGATPFGAPVTEATMNTPQGLAAQAAAFNPVTGGAGMGSTAGATAPPGMFGNLFGGNMGALKQALYTAGGAGLGQSLAPATAKPTQLPAGFTDHMPAVNPNYNAILGNGNNPRASFAGYNPIQAVTGNGYNFFAGQPGVT